MTELKSTLTPQEWFEKYVDMKKLEDNVIKSMVEAITYGNIEDDTYFALVHDIVNSHHGHYITYLALKYFEYEVDTDNIEQYDFEDAHWELERFTGNLENIINDKLDIHCNVGFGYWDADGTYCLMAFMDKDTYEQDKEEAYGWIADNFGEE